MLEENIVLKPEGSVDGEEKRLTPMRAIRKKCLDCSGTWHEVKLCPVTTCPLYVFRFGKNPYRPKREYTEEERDAMRARLAAARGLKVGEVADDLDDDLLEEFENMTDDLDET